MTDEENERLIEAARRKQDAQARGSAQAAKNVQGFSNQQLDEGMRRVKASRMTAGETIHDVDQSMARGAMEAVTGLPGVPADMFRLGQLARSYADTPAKYNPLGRDEYAGLSQPEVLARQDAEREAGLRKSPFGTTAPKPSTVANYGSQAFIDLASKYSPEMRRDPETPTGEVARRLTEGGVGGMMGGVAGGGRGMAREAIGGLAAAGAQEGVGAAGGGPAAQMAAGLIAGPMAASNGPGSRTAREALQAGGGTRGVDGPTLQRAEQLFQRARSEGINLTRANALDWITGGNAQGLSELQRVVESSGSPQLRQFFSEAAPPTPTTVRQYGGRVLDTIGPVSPSPGTLGPRAAEHSQAMINQAEQGVNTATRPQYQAFEHQPVDPAELQRLLNDPVFYREYQAVLTQPDYARFRQGLPPDSVGMVDLVRRSLSERQTNLTTPGASPEGMSATRAAGVGMSETDALNVASEGSRPPGAAPVGPSPLQEVRRDQADLRAANVDPLDQGPVGQIARSQSTPAAQAAIFPGTPPEGSHVQIGRAVANLTQRDPQLAQELVRNYLGTKFSTDTGRNVGGEPYTSGTKFWKDVAGTEQETRNLEAAISALPNGPDIWTGVREMGDIFEAMGKRQHPGSKTAFNVEDIEKLKGKGFTDASLKLISSAFTAVPGMAKDALERFRLGRNMDEISRLITDPQAGEEFARIMRETRPNTAQRAINLMRLTTGPALQQQTAPLVRSPLMQPPEEAP